MDVVGHSTGCDWLYDDPIHTKLKLTKDFQHHSFNISPLSRYQVLKDLVPSPTGFRPIMSLTDFLSAVPAIRRPWISRHLRCFARRGLLEKVKSIVAVAELCFGLPACPSKLPLRIFSLSSTLKLPNDRRRGESVSCFRTLEFPLETSPHFSAAVSLFY